jgi:hypothetical protein
MLVMSLRNGGTHGGENRTPANPIGEIVHAQEQAKRTIGHLPPHGPGARQEDVKAKRTKSRKRKRRISSDGYSAEGTKWANIPVSRDIIAGICAGRPHHRDLRHDARRRV